MEYGGKKPNEINQVSQSLLSIDVQGVEQINISTSSVDISTSLNVEGGITASSYSGSFVGDGSSLIGTVSSWTTGCSSTIVSTSSTSTSVLLENFLTASWILFFKNLNNVTHPISLSIYKEPFILLSICACKLLILSTFSLLFIYNLPEISSYPPSYNDTPQIEIINVWSSHNKAFLYKVLIK